MFYRIVFPLYIFFLTGISLTFPQTYAATHIDQRVLPDPQVLPLTESKHPASLRKLAHMSPTRRTPPSNRRPPPSNQRPPPSNQRPPPSNQRPPPSPSNEGSHEKSGGGTSLDYRKTKKINAKREKKELKKARKEEDIKEKQDYKNQKKATYRAASTERKRRRMIYKRQKARDSALSDGLKFGKKRAKMLKKKRRENKNAKKKEAKNKNAKKKETKKSDGSLFVMDELIRALPFV